MSPERSVTYVSERSSSHVIPDLQWCNSSLMHKIALSLLLVSSAALAQYKSEAAGTPPAELAPGISQALQQQGTKILAGDGTTFCEIWFRTALPSGPKPTDQTITLSVPQGAL